MMRCTHEEQCNVLSQAVNIRAVPVLSIRSRASNYDGRIQTADCITDAETRDRTGDLQIFSLTLSQLSYRGSWTQVKPSLAVTAN